MIDTLSIGPAAAGVQGELRLPGDKSISHRAVMFASLAHGESRIRNCSLGGDNRSTIGAFRALGVDIQGSETASGSEIVVNGQGWHGLQAPTATIDCGNSGTTARLLCGILAGRPFSSRLDGDASLCSRPMDRVIKPLREMGARITSQGGDNRLPLYLQGLPPQTSLHGISYRSPVASAQLKSALLLAGLQAEGVTQVWEPVRSRDHTERMLSAFGARLEVQETSDGPCVSIAGGQALHACEVDVPGDVSSAAFFIGASLIAPHSEIVVRDVGVNPTRTGVLDIFRAMGGHVRILNERNVGGEPVGDIAVQTSRLHGTQIQGEMVVRAIDEFPIIAVVAAWADGTTTIRGAEELRVKESDRIQAMATALRTLGVSVAELPDGLIIEGHRGTCPSEKTGALHVNSAGDHRIAMALSIAGLVTAQPVIVHQAACVDISFPNFYPLLQELSGTDIQPV